MVSWVLPPAIVRSGTSRPAGFRAEDLMTQLNSSLKEWGAVAAHAEELKSAHLRDLTAADPKRWQSFHVEHDTWLLDMSRQRITARSEEHTSELQSQSNLVCRLLL